MTEVEKALSEALERGDALSFSVLGGPDRVLAEAKDLMASRWAGSVIELVLRELDSGAAAASWSALIAHGLKTQDDRHVLSEMVSSLAQAQLSDYELYAEALEHQVRDKAAAELLRVEAAASIMRFALIDRELKHLALNSLRQLKHLTDQYAGGKFCRLASLAFEQFQDEGVVGWLESHTANPNLMSEAAFELGTVRFSQALVRTSFEQIKTGLELASTLFEQSVMHAEDNRNADVHRLLTKALLGLADPSIGVTTQLANELKEKALFGAMWDVPAAGYEWLQPPAGANLEWIPVVDDLVRVAENLASPTWHQTAKTFDHVVRLYQSERAVRPEGASIGHFLKPAIEARFIEESGLLARLDGWLDFADENTVGAADGAVLRSNIAKRMQESPPPGKTPGARTSRARSLRN